MANFGNNKKVNKFYRTNHGIQANELQVIGSDGTNLGVITKSQALALALEQGLDLVEIAPQAKPPVARIVDFQKFRYEENKKEQAAKKNAKDVEQKEIWLTPRIAEHDLMTRLRRAQEFLDDGDKVFIRVKFKGREMAHLEFGYQLLDKIYAHFGDKIKVERPAKLEGRSITAIIGKGKEGSTKQEVVMSNE